MISAWSQAVACFGAETMATLVVELSKTGLPAQQLQRPPLGSSAPATQSPPGAEGAAAPAALPAVSAPSASSCAIILEGAAAALRSAAAGAQWGSEVPAILVSLSLSLSLPLSLSLNVGSLCIGDDGLGVRGDTPLAAEPGRGRRRLCTGRAAAAPAAVLADELQRQPAVVCNERAAFLGTPALGVTLAILCCCEPHRCRRVQLGRRGWMDG